MQTISHGEQLSAIGPGRPMKEIQVLIVDEHLAVRRALAARLNSFPQISVAATANSFRKGIELTIALRPDVVLLELKGGSCTTWRDPVGEMREALAGRPAGIIVLTSYADDIEREAALQAGANRYLLKRIDSLSLLREIEAVAVEVSEHTS